MKSIRKGTLVLFGAMVAAVCALCALPGMAFAATNVTVNYTAAGTSKSAVVDLDTLADTSSTYGYMFQKGGVNVVIKADKTVMLEDALSAAVDANGDATHFDDIWKSGKTLTFTVDNGLPYTKYTQFTYDRLMAQNLFFGDTLWTGSPLGMGENAPAVLALSSGTQKMTVGDTGGSVRDDLAFTTDAAKSPRLLWGWPSANVPADQFGGNRYPSNIDSITIS